MVSGSYNNGGCVAHESLDSRIDPILLETVIMEDFGSVLVKRDRLGQFLFKLTHGKPVGYYLAIFGAFSQTEMVNCILGICAAGVENLVLLVSPRDAWKFDLFDKPLAGCHLCRLIIQLDQFFPSGFESEATQPNFHHPCFKNITIFICTTLPKNGLPMGDGIRSRISRISHLNSQARNTQFT